MIPQKKYRSFEVIELLKNQKDAFYECFRIYENRIRELEEEADDDSDEKVLMYKFLRKIDNNIVETYINIAYKEYPKDIAYKYTHYLHDEIIDMSKIDCCKDQFKPWAV